MPKAIWNGQILAESNQTIIVEGNHYFPPASVNKSFLKESSQTSICPWKGLAKYYDIEVDGKVTKAAAWTYPSPKPAARNISDHIAFWKEVKVNA